MELKNEFITWLLDNKLDHIAGSVLLNNVHINYEKYIETNDEISFNIRFNIVNNDDFNKVAPEGCEFIFENKKWKIRNISTNQTIELKPYKELNKNNAMETFNFLTKILNK